MKKMAYFDANRFSNFAVFTTMAASSGQQMAIARQATVQAQIHQPQEVKFPSKVTDNG